MAFDFSGTNFSDSGQRQSANDRLRGYVGQNNPLNFDPNKLLQGYAGFSTYGQQDDNAFRNVLWNAAGNGQPMADNFLTDPNQLAAYRSGSNAFNAYKTGDNASLEEELKKIPALAGNVNNLNSGNTLAYNNMVSNGTLTPYGAPEINTNPTAMLSNAQPGQTASQVAPGAAATATAGAVDPNSPGAYPVGVVEPLNDWQKTALTKLNTGAPDSGLADKASTALTAANLGLTNPTANIGKYMNPLQDYLTGEVNNTFDAQNNAIRARAARMGNTGSSSEALQQSLNDKNRANTIGTLSANNWNTAMGQASNAINQNLGLSSAYQGLDNYGTQKYIDAAKTSLGAGGVAQDNNQKLLDAAQAEINRQLAYPYSQIDFLRQILGAYPTGSTQTTTSSGNALGGAVGGGLLGNYLGSQGSTASLLNTGGNVGTYQFPGSY